MKGDIVSEYNHVDIIYAELKRRIIKNEYVPGEVVSENSIAAGFNVSRTPVREALKKLQHEKLVITIPKVGIQVSTIEINELKNNFEVRKALEELVIKTVIPIITSDELSSLEEIADLYKTLDSSDDSEDRVRVIEVDVMFHEKLWSFCNNEILVRYLKELNYTEQRWWYYMKKMNPSLGEVGDIGSLINLIQYLKNKDEENAIKVMHKHLEYYILRIKNSFF